MSNKMHMIVERYSDGDVVMSEEELEYNDVIDFWTNPDKELDLPLEVEDSLGGNYSSLVFEMGRTGRTWIVGDGHIAAFGRDRESACCAFVDAKQAA